MVRVGQQAARLARSVRLLARDHLSGQFAVVDSAAPYHFDFSGRWRMMSYRVPHHLLDERVAGPNFGLGVAVDATGGTGRVVASLMRSLWELGDAPGLPPSPSSNRPSLPPPRWP